jgi:hypothetical protein
MKIKWVIMDERGGRTVGMRCTSRFILINNKWSSYRRHYVAPQTRNTFTFFRNFIANCPHRFVR